MEREERRGGEGRGEGRGGGRGGEGGGEGRGGKGGRGGRGKKGGEGRGDSKYGILRRVTTHSPRRVHSLCANLSLESILCRTVLTGSTAEFCIAC